MSSSLRIAVIATTYMPETHADVIVSRWLEPFPYDAEVGWQPTTQIVSLYVEQLTEKDMSSSVCAKHGVRRFSTVAEALTLGGNYLAVDAVILIGEHGAYPLNKFGQKLYPRKELFDQVVAVFRQSRRVVPLFFDKHLSWNMAWAHEMYWVIRDLEIPFFGGSSLPFSPFVPPAKLSAAPEEIVAIYWSSPEAYLFHSLELVETLLEDLPREEWELSSVVAWSGGEVWEAFDDGRISPELLDAAAGSISHQARDAVASLRKERSASAHAFQFSGPKGIRITYFMQDSVIRKWAFGWRNTSSEPCATHVQVGGRAKHFTNFALLNREIQKFFLTRVAPWPPERLYRTTLATAACMQALRQPNVLNSTTFLCGAVRRAQTFIWD